MQDGALASVGKILDRMSELKTMSLDVTKNSLDIANYDAEFNQLQEQLSNIREEKFNGINLFTTSHSDLNTYTTEVGDGVFTSATKVAPRLILLRCNWRSYLLNTAGEVASPKSNETFSVTKVLKWC